MMSGTSQQHIDSQNRFTRNGLERYMSEEKNEVQNGAGPVIRRQSEDCFKSVVGKDVFYACCRRWKQKSKNEGQEAICSTQWAQRRKRNRLPRFNKWNSEQIGVRRTKVT